MNIISTKPFTGIALQTVSVPTTALIALRTTTATTIVGVMSAEGWVQRATQMKPPTMGQKKQASTATIPTINAPKTMNSTTTHPGRAKLPRQYPARGNEGSNMRCRQDLALSQPRPLALGMDASSARTC